MYSCVYLSVFFLWCFTVVEEAPGSVNGLWENGLLVKNRTRTPRPDGTKKNYIGCKMTECECLFAAVVSLPSPDECIDTILCLDSAGSSFDRMSWFLL